METQTSSQNHMKKDIAVVILNFNGQRFLERFLADVEAKSHHIADVIVADNASADDSLAYLQQHHPNVAVIKLPKNYGFAGGYNLALKDLKYKYFVLLNSDIEVADAWLEPLYEMMESDDSIAACQPKLLSFADKAYFEYAGAGGGFIDKFGYPFCRGRLFQHLEKDEGQYDDAVEVFWASGACMFVRAETYNILGGLDDSFFAHMEEIDFCWRAKNQHYKIMYCPQSVVYHIGGGTLPKMSARKTYLNFRNNLSMLYKNLPPGLFLYAIITRLFLDGIASLKFLADGGVGDFLAVLRAHLHFYRKLPKLRKQRRQIKPKQVSHIYQKNIVLEYFLFQKHYFTSLDSRRFR
jgi:hypothetical protein